MLETDPYHYKENELLKARYVGYTKRVLRRHNKLKFNTKNTFKVLDRKKKMKTTRKKKAKRKDVIMPKKPAPEYLNNIYYYFLRTNTHPRFGLSEYPNYLYNYGDYEPPISGFFLKKPGIRLSTYDGNCPDPP